MPGKFRDTVTVSTQPFDGNYVYNRKSNPGAITYYKDGDDKSLGIHFTVVGSDNGNDPLRRFHISKEFSGKNFHLKYFWNERRKVVQYDGSNADELPTKEKNQALDFFEAQKDKLIEAAWEFATNLPKQSSEVVFAESMVARPPEVPVLPQPNSTAAVTLPTLFNLGATPILSQANAVGQGFDIFGSFDTESLVRPLVDSSGATTQVFTFLGKDYLVPGYVTAVESTSSYSNVAAGVNRDGFQNSIAAHAGVEGSYGAFSGEMKADFTGEYNENSAFTYGFIDFYTSLATLQLNTAEYLSPDFREAIAALPDVASEETLPPFIDFFTRYGVYYVQRVTLGASLGFYTALSKRDTLTKVGFELLLKAQYKGLFSSGQLDSSVKASAEWKQYSESSVTSLRVLGGSPAAAASLSSVDPLGFSQTTVAAFKNWADSASSEPAIVDFALSGIWNICSNKSGVVQAAWQLFGPTMRPRLSVETTTGNTPWPTPPAEPPVVTLGQVIRPAEPPTSPAGFLAIVFDGTNVSPNGVLLNRYFSVPLQLYWPHTYESMYSEILEALRGSGLTRRGNVLVLVSFGLDKGMTPPNELYALLQSAGAGYLLRQWIATADHGSKIGNDQIWIGSPINYCLVGLFGSGPDAGVEAYNAAQWGVPATLRLEALFYRTSITGQYTLGAGS